MNKALVSKAFLQNEVPGIIKKLKPEATPLWGEMTPLEMLEHLIITLKLSIGEAKVPIVTKPSQYEGIRNFLIGDALIPKYTKFPISEEERAKWKLPDLETAKKRLEAQIEIYIKFVEDRPEFMADHPYAGPMKSDDLMGFHQKHFLHHFTQFGLVKDSE